MPMAPSKAGPSSPHSWLLPGCSTMMLARGLQAYMACFGNMSLSGAMEGPILLGLKMRVSCYMAIFMLLLTDSHAPSGAIGERKRALESVVQQPQLGEGLKSPCLPAGRYAACNNEVSKLSGLFNVRTSQHLQCL